MWRRGGGGLLGVAKAVAVFSQPRITLRVKTKKTVARGKGRIVFFFEIQIIRFYNVSPLNRFLANPFVRFTMFYPPIILSEPGSSDLLRFPPQSFLAKSVLRIYYVLHLNRF